MLFRSVESIERCFASLFDFAGRASADPLYFDAARVARSLLNSPRDVRLLHGDMHHENILRSASRGWVAIDPQFLIGESAYDVANALYNPEGLPDITESPERLEVRVRILSQELQLDPERVLAFGFAHGGLSAAWRLEDGQDPEPRLRVARMLRQRLPNW